MSLSKHVIITTLLFDDDQIFFWNSESMLWIAIPSLNIICKDFGLQISAVKTKAMVFRELIPHDKNVVDATALEQLSNLEYMGYSVSCNTNYYMDKKQHIFNHMWGNTVKSPIKEIPPSSIRFLWDSLGKWQDILFNITEEMHITVC